MEKPTPNDTLQYTREFLRENWEKGCKCPACGQRVQLYNYKLFASSAFALLKLYKLGGEYQHIKKFAEATDTTPRAPHFAELRFWGFVEAMPKSDDPKKKSSGFWKITDKGKKFVRNELKVQSRILVFNNHFAGWAANSVPITLKESLGNDFDYEELMGHKKESY